MEKIKRTITATAVILTMISGIYITSDTIEKTREKKARIIRVEKLMEELFID